MTPLVPIIYIDYYTCKRFQKEIAQYCSWIEGRLFPQIGTWDDEEQKSTTIFEEMTTRNNYSEEDLGDYYERGHDLIISHCLSTAEINAYMIGVSIVGLYHLWEKQVCSHLAREIQKDRDVADKELPTKWDHIIRTFEDYSTPLTNRPCHADINELRLVTNAMKHGGGPSFDDLIKLNADILQQPLDAFAEPVTGGAYSLLRVELHPRKEHFFKYKKAVLDFWDHDYWRSIGEHRPYRNA